MCWQGSRCVFGRPECRRAIGVPRDSESRRIDCGGVPDAGREGFGGPEPTLTGETGSGEQGVLAWQFDADW